jgi:DNA-binding transcriptional ArsR family regulator
MTAWRRPYPPDPGGLDPRLIKALSHPLRHRLLLRLNYGEASPAEMARELGVPVGRVSHHVRTLSRLGAIELVRTAPRRGAIEHFYRATMPAWFTDEDWAQVPASARRAIADQNLREVLRDIAAAGGAGFERADAHLSRLPLRLDAEAMAEVVALLNATLERVLAIQEASDRRAQDARVDTEAVILHFELPQSSDG